MTPKALLIAIARLHESLAETHAQLIRGEPDALHRMRVCLRQLRSLIKPVARKPPFKALYDSSQALADITNPVRELEVLVGELQARQSPAAAPRAATLPPAYEGILHHPALDNFQAELEDFVGHTRKKDLPGKRQLKARIQRSMEGWQDGIQQALKDGAAENVRDADGSLTLPETERHRLRILVKRLRYTLAAFDNDVPKPLRSRLKSAQDSVGNWHDRLNWLAQAADASDLVNLVPQWESDLQHYAREADDSLLALKKPLKQWARSTNAPRRKRR